MSVFILVIGFFIHCYAENYLESDTTQLRFLSQLNFVLLSVLLLVLAANLLTAFIAWQFIGISLYLLLNHYHYDAAANRSAKKKFVINRLGDSSFLLAIILAYHTHSASSFISIQSSAHAELICALLFISVMTKCAQFPFHIWLIDTMETPTPVSALMHAGVINAGGILLARVSHTLNQYQGLCILILFAGLSSALLSINWMNRQPDTKRKLAYSTMGQMGYMVAQCSLGAFSAAVFHLISHGFYKASLFLNAGETLKTTPEKESLPIGYIALLKSLLITLVIFSIGVLYIDNKGRHIPLLILGFIFFTLYSLILKVNLLKGLSYLNKSLYYFMISLVFFCYLLCFHLFSSWLPSYDLTATIPFEIQIALLIFLATLQYFLWTKNVFQQTKFIDIKDATEVFLRKYLLYPLRILGNIVNDSSYKKILNTAYLLALLFTLGGFFHGILKQAGSFELVVKGYPILIFLYLCIAIISLVIANRCLTIRSLLIYLLLFELAFTNIAFFDGNTAIIKIGIFHIINISAVLLMLSLLAKQGANHKVQANSTNNRLPSRVFYLVFSLLLLIGIPGSASFISEFYLLNSIINYNPLFVFMYISLIILVAIVVMHSLQLYAFNKYYSKMLLKPLGTWEHCMFLTIISLNVFSGLFPNLLLNYL